MKRLNVGIIGGMGPAATLDLMDRMLRLSFGKSDQDSVRMLVDNNPLLPDRNLAIAGKGPSPGPQLAAMARGLEKSGADFLVIACNTAHAFAPDIRAAVYIPLLDMIAETVAALPAGPAPVGLMAAAGCLDAGLYQKALAGRTLLLPDRQALMTLLYDIKTGDTGPAIKARMAALAQGLADQGAAHIIAGCTEVPLVLGAGDVAVPLLDSTAILARTAMDIAYSRRALPNI